MPILDDGGCVRAIPPDGPPLRNLSMVCLGSCLLIFKRRECNLRLSVVVGVCCIGALYPGFNLLNIIKLGSPAFLRRKKSSRCGCRVCLKFHSSRDKSVFSS
jgi:hypothetical protein